MAFGYKVVYEDWSGPRALTDFSFSLAFSFSFLHCLIDCIALIETQEHN